MAGTRAKQTQFGGVKCAKRTQFARRRRAGRSLGDVGRGANAQNEANFRLRRVGRHRRRRGARGNHAKRTQFARQGQPGKERGEDVQNEANFPRAGSPRECIVRNKANLLRGHGRPSPRPEALTLPRAGRSRGPIVQDEPNFRHQRKKSGSRCPTYEEPPGPNVQNEANSGQVPGRASTWREKSYGELYKQSQFAWDRPEEKAGAGLWSAEFLKALRVPPHTRRRSRLRGCDGGSRPLR